MKHAMIRKQVLLPAALVLAAFAACDGGSKVGQVGSGSRPELASVELGRLVDVYAYRRIDPAVGDRRLRTQRQLHRVAQNVVINANIDSQPLFDAAGQVVATANYEFLPFDKNVGHEELVILWDDRQGAESDRFQQAFTSAQQGLLQVPASFRGQSTQSRPIPIVARNAAIRLRFTGQVDVDQAFFTANPSSIQLLEFKGDPSVVDPADAFRILPYRVIPQGDSIILDTTILAGEANGGLTSSGLPQSSDSVTANIRIAIPSRGSVVPSFYIKEDSVQALNGVDSAGRDAVIRDFRSGNLQDGAAGRVREPEAPMIVASLPMGIQAIDAANGLITLNKRLGFVPVRGRYPFVDGPLNANGIPLGPLTVPIQRPLSHGDILTQTVQVTMPDGSVESVTLKAEVLQNRNVGTVVGDPQLPRLGLAENTQPGDSGQSELDSVAVIRVATVSPGVDSLGRPVSFRASTLPAGEECLLRAVYHEEVPFIGSSAVLSDRPWRNLFTRIEPRPAVATTGVAPNASVAVEFTKPMDLDQVDNTANYLVTSQPVAGVTETFEQQMTDPKRAKTRIVPTRLSDITGDGTVLRLQPPMGFFHRFDSAPAATGERYSVHVRTGTAGVTDLAGNPLQLFDSLAAPQGSWSVEFALAPNAPDNLIGYIPYPFEADDEDGTLPGSADIFGQYRLENGRLTAAAGVRFSRSADQQNLATISRITRGECWFLGAAQQPGPPIVPAVPPGQRFPQAPVDAAGAVHPGLLYWRARMSDSIGPQPVPAPSVYDYWQTQAQPVGRVIEPMKPQGSRMQMRYVEDDFSLSYRQPSEFGLDVEQLYWSPFNKESVQFDVFDRFTMSLSHSRRRTDEFWSLTGQDCILRCASMNSSLVNTFSENVLEGADVVPVFQDKVYRINPNDVFRTNENEFYVPFPRFDRTYTWRDSRLVTVDTNGNVIGLGGAQQPQAVTPNNDFTANIDSPWITDASSLTGTTLGTALFGYNAFVAAGGSTWVMDGADFVGTNQRDHDPIALPLLVDFMVFPDDAANGLANGSNGFQVAMLGPPSYGFPGASGYYDTLPAGCAGFPAWPRVRVHASGGFDLITGNAITIDPANQLVAQASVVKDAGLGAQATALFTAPPGDGMLNWARADFVRKVSTMTIGFFDTLQPQRAQLLQNGALLSPEAGFPNLLGIDPNLRISDLVVQIDPPQARQPAGTSVVVELRGAETFGNANTLYNPSFNQLGQTSNDTFDGRGNLLNANYACEAYRYSTANAPGVARVAADGLTRYVTEDQLGLIRNPATGLLPRFMNVRLVMSNNVSVSPALSPSLRSMGIVYRLQPNQ